MASVMVCPQGHGSFEDLERCPACGTELLQRGDQGPSEPPPLIRENWSQSPGGRVLVGMLLALALSYGLLQLCMALLRAIGKDAPSGELHPFAGLILFQGVQGLALLGGGILAGAGQRRGIAYGAMVGVLSGLLTISAVLSGLVHGLVQSFSQEMLTPGTPVRNMAMYALPVLHAAFGALGVLALALRRKTAR